MQSCDTNILLYYLDATCEAHDKAKAYVESVWKERDFTICDLVLAELYVLLRNPKVFKRPLGAKEAAKTCLLFRTNPNWQVIETVFGVMPDIWRKHAEGLSSAWGIYDLRLGLTLKQAGVRKFATRNVKDFSAVGFEKVINPID